MTSNNHPAFESLGSKNISSLNVDVETYRHKGTGSIHYHLKTDNQENVFLVGLKTVPQDSTGAAHILEHTVLCGSKKYPVRDPFFMMIRRSLNTFMNAFTSSDWTAYPFASLNKTDFNNLLDVYLDAVFFPNIDPLDFSQEGHRVEFEEIENMDSDLVYKGVVFNEMKGAMSSPISFAWQKLTSYLYPGTTYKFNSGGEPADIPGLSYEGLQSFYKTHYHPSNAVFFTFGDIPAASHQETLHNEVLQHFTKSEEPIIVNPVQRYSKPQHIIDFYPAEEDEQKQHVLVGWLLGESTDIKQQMASILLSSALFDNSSSPMRYALENSDLGKAPSPLCGLEDSNKEMVFICGLEGAEPDSEKEIEALVLGVLNDVANNGIEQERLEAVLHQIELSQKEITGGSYPYGMQLILDMLPQAIHGGDPIQAIDLDSVLEDLRIAIQDPQYIKDLVADLLLNNNHRVLLSLKPDKDLETKQDLAEKRRLAQQKSIMTDAEKQKVVDLSLALKARQEQVDDESILPKVGKEDVPDEVSIAIGTDAKIAEVSGKTYVQGTNGIVYEQLITRIPNLTNEELSLLPLYTHSLCDLGFANKSYLEAQALLDSHTGGIQCFSSMRSDAYDTDQYRSFLVFSGKSLFRKQEKLIELMSSFINDVRFDELDRIKELVAQWRVRKENSITGNGHSLAMLAASHGMSPLAEYKHLTRGLLGIQQVKQWDDSFDDVTQLESIAERLQQLHVKIQSAEKRFLLVGDETSVDELAESRKNYYQAIKSEPTSAGLVLPNPTESNNQCWLTNTQVNFCSRSYKTVAPYHDDGPALMVLGGFLKNGILHRTIREQGGAYGGGAGYDSDAGAFRFYSYRDPRLGETLADFDASIDWLLNNQHSAEKLEEAILGVISGIDKPSSPAGEAKSAFHNELFGRSAEKRQELRRQVLQVSLKDLKAVGEKYLKQEQAASAVLTSESNWEKQGVDGFEIKHL